MTDKLRDLIEDVRTVYEGKGMLVSPNSFDRLRTEITKLDNINKQQSEQIEKLEEENAELREKWLQAAAEVTSWANLKHLENENTDLKNQLNTTTEQLTKAKSFLKCFVWYFRRCCANHVPCKQNVEAVEQFLKKCD